MGHHFSLVFCLKRSLLEEKKFNKATTFYDLKINNKFYSNGRLN